jgi:hypothetical protein
MRSAANQGKEQTSADSSALGDLTINRVPFSEYFVGMLAKPIFLFSRGENIALDT